MKEKVEGEIEENVEENIEEENLVPQNLKDEKDVNVEVIINVKGDSEEESQETSEEIKGFLDAIDDIKENK